MNDPSPDSGAAASRGGASWRNLVAVLTSPREGFAGLAARPTFALALVLLGGGAALASRRVGRAQTA